MKIGEHLYVYMWNDPRENNCNSIVIDGKVPILIDPGHLHRINELFQRIAEDGINPRSIKVVIVTHGHPDHFGATLAFKEPQAKIGVSLQEERYIDEVARPMYAKQGVQLPDHRVDFYLKDGELDLGKHHFEILLTPGHTPGSLSIYWPRYKALFSGDLVFMQGVGRVDLPGGNLDALKQSIKRVSEMPVELIVPGHGPAVQGSAEVKRNFEYIAKALLRS